MVVHIYGLPVDMEPISNLAAKYGLSIIEDAAEMLGQTYKDRPCGSFGDLSTFSFYPNKHITTGEGGIVLNDEVPFDAKVAMPKLAAEKIGTPPFFWGMHKQPVFQSMGLFEGISCIVVSTSLVGWR